MAKVINDVNPTKGISTAVAFLDEVPKQKWNEDYLAKYLEKQGLPYNQVKEAFRIHHAKYTKMSRQNSRSKIMFDQWKSPISRSLDQGAAKPLKRRMASLNKNNSEQLKIATCNSSNLRLEKQVVGRKLIKEFLEHEKGYCKVLRCLNDEYLRELT